ncbi:MAG TPA: 2-C-methyl-D-erythritol 4-phosphate cytidylyltransferase [Jatrophihabitantaceae bacterium]
MRIAAILVAAGTGQRLGADVPKAFCTVRGRTLLSYAHARFAAHPKVGRVIVVAPADRIGDAKALTGPDVVAGGATRQASVAAGLAVVPHNVDAVLVHDVARAFVPADVIDRVVAALRDGADAVIPTRPVTDTIKRVDAGGRVIETVARSTLVAVQTPQGFRRDVLIAAHAAGSGDVTDDAGLVEALGGTVVAVDGADEAFKITRPWDLLLAEALAAR